jgi:hypothetical protein
MPDLLTWFLVAPRLGLSVNQDALNSVTRGLVGDTSFAVLPEVTSQQTFVLTFIFQLVCIIPRQIIRIRYSYSIDPSCEALVPFRSQLGDICRSSDTLWIRLLPFRLARP